MDRRFLISTRGAGASAQLATVALLCGLMLSLPDAQGASPRIKLVSCANSLFDNEPAALNRCRDARTLNYDFLTSTDRAVYTSQEDAGLEVWRVTADGRITQGPCYGGRGGCQSVPGLFEPREMIASPDGNHLYVSNREGITIHDIASDGSLAYKDCVGPPRGSGGSAPCSERIPGPPDQQGYLQARAPALAPDGRRYYFVDYRGVLTLERRADGHLEYIGCQQLDQSSCQRYGPQPFVSDHAATAVSPDSRFVYIATGYSNAKVKGFGVGLVHALERADSSPGLRLIQTLKLPVWGLDEGNVGRTSAAISADGRHMYATLKNKLVTFARDKRSGKLRVLRCLGEDGYVYDTKDCLGVRPTPRSPHYDSPTLSEPHQVLLTRDGRGAVVAGATGILWFTRSPSSGVLGTTATRQGDRFIVPYACASTARGLGNARCENDVPFQNFRPDNIALSHRGDRLFTTVASTVLASMTSPVAGRAARAATAEAGTVEHRLGINNWMVGPTRSKVSRVYRGTEVKPLSFAVGIDLITEHGGDETTEAVRMTLPKGLSWGARGASPRTLFPNGVPDYWSFTPKSESCAVSGQVVTCRAEGVPNSTNLFGWILDVKASVPGKYTIRGEVVPPTDGRNRPPRGVQTPETADLNLIVGERSGPVEVSRVVIARSRPSRLTAVVEVTRGGVSVRPSSGLCTSRLPFASEKGGYRTSRGFPDLRTHGKVECTYVFDAKRNEGKLFAGELAFTVGKTRMARAFTVRIGPGTGISAPTGAVIGAPTKPKGK